MMHKSKQFRKSDREKGNSEKIEGFGICLANGMNLKLAILPM